MSKRPTASRDASGDKSRIRRHVHDELQNDVLVRLSKERLGTFWPHPTGMAFRDGEPVRYGLVGSPDIVGFSEGGFFVGIEIKTGAGELRENQRNFRSICLMRGAVHIVGRDVDQVVMDLKTALRYKGVLLQAE